MVGTICDGAILRDCSGLFVPNDFLSDCVRVVMIVGGESHNRTGIVDQCVCFGFCIFATQKGVRMDAQTHVYIHIH